uniref:AsparaginetRNA ligaseic/mitochondrial-like n=1 Tax=Rhizophora mucronata TaxID=61149 RepID=A0A2P2LT73_RHIMU
MHQSLPCHLLSVDKPQLLRKTMQSEFLKRKKIDKRKYCSTKISKSKCTH